MTRCTEEESDTEVNPPVAKITVDKTNVTVGEQVKFTNTSTGTIDEVSWKFEGG